jgi:hypothetical protein
MPTQHKFSATGAVDEATGKISGVSLISVGPARGHFDKEGRQLMVDAKTIEQVSACALSMGSVKVRADHGSGVFSTIGFIDNIRQMQGRVIGDLNIYESEGERAKLFEIAQKNPDHLGLSLEFEGEDEIAGETKLSRCASIIAVALVSDPAANKSLFSAKPFDNIVKNNACNSDNTNPQTKFNMASPTDDNDKKTADKPVVADPATTYCTMKQYDELSARLKKFEDAAVSKNPNDPSAGDAGKATPPTVNPSVQPAVQNPDEKQFEARLEAAANKGAETAVKLFAAQFGIKPAAAGASDVKVPDTKLPVVDAAKAFAALVDAKTTELKGDRTAATLFCIKNHKTEYAATRLVAPKK